MRPWYLWLVLPGIVTASLEAQIQVPLITDLAPCAVSCNETAFPLSGCDAADIDCVCHSHEYMTSLRECMANTCSVKETLVATHYHKSACGAPVRDEGGSTRRITWALFVMASVAVIARYLFRARYFHGSGFGFDDYTILVGLIMILPLYAFIDAFTIAGVGRDIWTVQFDNITNILYFFWIGEFIYIWIMSITKVSIVMLYLRIWSAQPGARDWFRILCFAMIVFLITSGIAMSLALGFECNPISFAWLKWDGEHQGTCFNLSAQLFALAGINIGQDLFICLLPLMKLARLTLPARKKTVVCFTFLVGLFVTLCSVVRLQYLVEWGTTDNPTWYYNPIALWSAIECNLAVTCACLPAVFGLCQRAYRYSKGVAANSVPSAIAKADGRRSGDLGQWHPMSPRPSTAIREIDARDVNLPNWTRDGKPRDFVKVEAAGQRS